MRAKSKSNQLQTKNSNSNNNTNNKGKLIENNNNSLYYYYCSETGKTDNQQADINGAEYCNGRADQVEAESK